MAAILIVDDSRLYRLLAITSGHYTYMVAILLVTCCYLVAASIWAAIIPYTAILV